MGAAPSHMASYDADVRDDGGAESLSLLGGDVLVIALFVTAGSLNHGISPLSEPLAVAETVAPFLVGWFVAAPLVRVHERGAVATPRRAARLAAGAWLGAANVGLLLRGSPYFTGGTTWPFPLVMTGVGLLSLVSWRVVAGRLLPAGEGEPGH